MQLFLSFYFDLVTTITWPKANVPEKELAGTEKKSPPGTEHNLCGPDEVKGPDMSTSRQGRSARSADCWAPSASNERWSTTPYIDLICSYPIAIFIKYDLSCAWTIFHLFGK